MGWRLLVTEGRQPMLGKGVCPVSVLIVLCAMCLALVLKDIDTLFQLRSQVRGYVTDCFGPVARRVDSPPALKDRQIAGANKLPRGARKRLCAEYSGSQRDATPPIATSSTPKRGHSNASAERQRRPMEQRAQTQFRFRGSGPTGTGSPTRDHAGWRSAPAIHSC